jgi:hypothetical protein
MRPKEKRTLFSWDIKSMSRPGQVEEETTIETLCSAGEAIANLREVFRIRMSTSEILARFWCLQDLLNRLLSVAAENPKGFFNILERGYPTFIPEVLDLISFASKAHLTQIAAVYQSCESINDRLLRINMLKVSGAPCYTSTDDLSRIPHLANGMNNLANLK